MCYADSPVVNCDEPSAQLGETNISLTCRVKARPEVTVLYWTDVKSGTKLIAGDFINNVWTSNMASITRIYEYHIQGGS